MISKTGIQWTGGTYNPWYGCKKISEGCKFCYMYRDRDKDGVDPSLVIRSKSETFNKPLYIETQTLIFTCSWSDFFNSEADEWRPEVWKIMKNTPHVYQILTKRPERILECLPDDWGEGYENVWLGVSVENQDRLNRIDILSTVPSKTKFVSFEPLLSEIRVSEKHLETIDWAIIGGESGDLEGKHGFRECKLEWIEILVEDLQSENIPVFVKQLGTHIALENNLRDTKKGGKMNELPPHLQIREFPNGIKYSDDNIFF